MVLTYTEMYSSSVIMVSLYIQMVGNHMHHYTYKLTYSDGKYYIGVRSCKCKPKEDSKYIGSSKYTPNKLLISKEILKEFEDRAAAVQHEIDLHNQLDVGKSDLYYNRSKQTSTKFDTTGLVYERTLEHNHKIKEALTGRVRRPEECSAISNGKKGSKYNSPRPPEVYAQSVATRRANDKLSNPMKDKKYAPNQVISLYAHRCNYSDVYTWKNKTTQQVEYATCQEMGLKYGVGVKPTGRFRNIIKGVSKSYHGWTLHTDSD